MTTAVVPNPELVETLRQAQRLGFFGPGPIERAIDHADAFVEATDDLPPGGRIVDLGSGGGLPGLVLADAIRTSSVLLIDRREKRTDFLRRAVSRLGFDHADVRCDDVATLVADVEAARVPAFDVVTARGFGPPGSTLTLARRLMTDDGRIVISEPPSTEDRWDAELLGELSLDRERRGSVSVFRRR